MGKYMMSGLNDLFLRVSCETVEWLQKERVLKKYPNNVEGKVFPMISEVAVWFPETELDQ